MSMTKETEFGARLREYRKRAGRTLQEVADRCGCTRDEVLFLERAGLMVAVDRKVLMRILRVVRCPGMDRLARGYDRATLPNGRIRFSLRFPR